MTLGKILDHCIRQRLYEQKINIVFKYSKKRLVTTSGLRIEPAGGNLPVKTQKYIVIMSKIYYDNMLIYVWNV